MADRPTPRAVVDYLALATPYLAARGSSSPRLDAELLLGKVLGLARLELYLHHDRPLDGEEVSAFRDLMRRRGTGEPVAYLLGRWGFRRLDLICDARALVPRPESEVLVELALARLPEGGTLVDVGTGTGAIALSVRSERPDARVLAVDLSPDALALARENAAALALEVTFLEGDLLAALPAGELVDVIAANLPYVAVGDTRIERGVHDHEPHLALYGGADGLELVRRLLDAAPARLSPGGSACLELGEHQAPAVVEIARAAGFGDVETARDLAGIERYVLARA
jgi:release factor glutamine methyltransferase